MKKYAIKFITGILPIIPICVITCFLFLYSSQEVLAGDLPIPLKNGMVISHSVTIKKSIYKLHGSHISSESVLIIKGDNIVVDFNGAELDGSSDKKNPDEFYGTAIQIKSGSNIVIKNAVIRGYKIAIDGRNIKNLSIDNCNLSYNYRQHLNSTREREDLSDWQSYHQNEKDEWMRFGAGIYLRDCQSATIKNNIIKGGQCGLMMTNCSNGIIYNNNFSFNSGIGVGLYRSSSNRVLNNKIDWNVRGVSYGVYYRGQDASAILVYEQSSHNIFAYNSATHSGDGFFLWAGASTLETGEGGCNDNLIYGNDFSYAPTNGVEVTFSSNKIIKNKMYDCDYGVWGGYSYNTQIMGNYFKNNNTGIAIEQGQDNTINNNSFTGDVTGIRLWATPGRSFEGKYDKKRDTRSMHYELKNNSFSSLHTVFNINHSEKLVIQNNYITKSNEFISLDSSVMNILIKNNQYDSKVSGDSLFGKNLAPQKLQDGQDAMLPENHLKGKQFIMMTEWGPYDFQSPILWLTKTDNSGIMYFDIFGPKGTWRVKNLIGVANLTATSDSVPGKLSVHKNGNNEIAVKLEYIGNEIISPLGKEYPSGSTYVFSYNDLHLPVTWAVQLFSFDKTTDPVEQPKAFSTMLRSGTPLRETKAANLNMSYWDKLDKNLPNANIATLATGEIDFPKGHYTIGVSAGDIVRVYIDNKLVINAWDKNKLINDADYHHDAKVSLEGKHTIRVEQAQYGDYGMLYLTILRTADQ
jgi:parallel beta-helix repeat protein